MTYNLTGIKVGSFCVQSKPTANQDVVEVITIDNGEVSYRYDGEINTYKLSTKLFSKMFKLTNPNIYLNNSGNVVGKLIKGNEVIVIITDGAYKGGHTTKVRYELAEFMDDEPPFMEILFVDKYDDTVYFTADMNEPVYELNGLLVVIGKGDNI